MLDKSIVSHKDRFRVWIEQAEHDLGAAKILLDSNYHEWVCYQSIQSVEKSLKSVIVHAGFRPPKTHKLGVLVSMCNRANSHFFDVKFNFRKIEGYTFMSRYPFVVPGLTSTPHEIITKNDASACISVAGDILSKVKSFLYDQKAQIHSDIKLEDYYFTKEEVDDRLNQIKRELLDSKEMQIQRITLFGAFARETTVPKTSTMDLLVIATTQLSFVERIQYVREITRGGEPIVEPLVYTPDEFSLMTEEIGEGFLESAIEEGRVIFENHPA